MDEGRGPAAAARAAVVARLDEDETVFRLGRFTAAITSCSEST